MKERKNLPPQLKTPLIEIATFNVYQKDPTAFNNSKEIVPNRPGKRQIHLQFWSTFILLYNCYLANGVVSFDGIYTDVRNT